MSKYDPLRRHLSAMTQTEWSATFEEIEAILCAQLPPSARNHRPWWANAGGSMVHQMAWLVAGWRAEDVDLTRETVRFTRTRIGGTIAGQSATVSEGNRVRGRPVIKASRAIVAAVERLPRRSNIQIMVPDWRLLGAGDRIADGWKLPLAESVAGVARIHIFENGVRRAMVAVADDLRTLLAEMGMDPTRPNGRKGRSLGLAAEIVEADDVVIEVAHRDQIFVIHDGASRRADLSDQQERKFVELALELASQTETQVNAATDSGRLRTGNGQIRPI